VGIQVFTSSIYEALHAYPSDIGSLRLTHHASGHHLGGIYWQSRFGASWQPLRDRERKGYRPRRNGARQLAYAAGGFFLLYSALVIGLHSWCWCGRRCNASMPCRPWPR